MSMIDWEDRDNDSRQAMLRHLRDETRKTQETRRTLLQRIADASRQLLHKSRYVSSDLSRS